MKRLLGLTWVGWLNILVLQWATLRLAYAEDEGKPCLFVVVPGIMPMTGWSKTPWKTYRRLWKGKQHTLWRKTT